MSDTHLVDLADGWSLWGLAALRSAGMPWSWLEAFAPGQHADEPAARAASAGAVRAIVRQPRFVEAVTWQNAAVVGNWLGAYAVDVASQAAPRLARRDQREALVALLAQRYCAKNETIGFFGPVAWARFDESGRGLVTAGSGGLRTRSLWVEGWLVRAVAAAFAGDDRLADHLIVRPHPASQVRDGLLVRPGRRPVELDPVAERVLHAARSGASLAELVGKAAADADPAQVSTTVRRLCAEGVLLAGVPVPIDGDPRGWLRRFVASLPEETLRSTFGALVDRLDVAVGRVAAAAGDPAALAGALDRLDDDVDAVAGRPAHRTKPDHRYGRAGVYEDCRRDTDVTIGSDVYASLRRPLSIVLDSARWFVSELGDEVERELRARWRALRRDTGREVSLADLVLASGDVWNGLPGTAVHRVVDDFQQRWAELLATATGDPARVDGSRVAPLAAALFPRQPVAWRAAVQHSPDLMLRAPVAGAGARPQWVLGELHMALNTLENRPFFTQCDTPGELLAACAADFPDGRIVPLYPPDAPEVTSRTYPPLAMDLPDRYTYWSYARDEGHPAGVSALPGSGLTVNGEGQRLVVTTPDGRWQAPASEFLGEFLTGLAVDRFALRPPAAHRPRALLDELVIARESWRVPIADVAPADLEPTDYRHAALARWLVSLGTPRWVFARTPGAAKPYLVDREAPLSLRNLARAMRQAADDPAATVELVEMLPAPDELWLADAAGDRYTSELRVVAVDRWQPRTAPIPASVADPTGGATTPIGGPR